MSKEKECKCGGRCNGQCCQCGNEGNPEFEWPEFSNEKERARVMKSRNKNLSIVEAFKNTYGEQIVEPGFEAPEAPAILKVGEVISVNLERDMTRGVHLGDVSSKEVIVCKNNLNRYRWNPEVFEHPIEALVVDVNKKQVTVDIIQPVFDRWIRGILTQPTDQKDIKNPQTVTVKDLQLTSHGFTGQAVIPELTEMLGEPYCVDAFIPGSHIVLNIEKDFTKWIGKTVETFVTNYVNKPGEPGKKSLVCSRKEYLTFIGDLNKIEMFKQWCEDSKDWKSMMETSYAGLVTGVINSSKKCGVFVEIPELNITGMVNMKPEEIVRYRSGQQVFVHITDFEEMTYYEETVKQRMHLDPYIIEDGKLRKCILKPVLKFA